MDKVESVSLIRRSSMGLTGGLCLIYAALVAATGDPTPIWPWSPVLLGGLTGLIIAASLALSGRAVAERATDELYRSQDHRAQRIGYWVALLLFPVFGALMSADAVTPALAFPMMGTLTAAAYLIPHALLTGGDG